MNRSYQCRLSGWMSMLAVACAMFGSVPVLSQTLDVPQPWISYAQLVGRQFQASLEANDEVANQLHQFLEDRIVNAKADAPPPALVVRAWIGADGAVTKVQFDSLGDPKADAVLRQLLTARPVPASPPVDMLQPLRVRLSLTPNPDPAQAGAATQGGAP